jgi:outer membrane protein OmpA-like peptidoglycan-associated protein
VVRAGLGCEYWFSEKAALTLEGNANMLPDHYNSKLGKHDNRDWRFNATIGVRFRLGEYNKKTTPVYEQRAQQAQRPVQQSARITKEQTDLTVYVQFIINQSIIRPTELQKLYELTSYLEQHPESHVLLTGYADKETGNPQINERLSRERADAVAAYLRSRGIANHRIHTDHKGDRIQPFDFPAQNRVCICIVLSPKYL